MAQKKSPVASTGAFSPASRSPGVRCSISSQPLPRRLALLQCRPENQRTSLAAGDDAAFAATAQPCSGPSPQRCLAEDGGDAQQGHYTGESERRAGHLPSSVAQSCEPTQLQDEVLPPTQLVTSTQVVVCANTECVLHPPEPQAVRLGSANSCQHPADGTSLATAPEAATPQHAKAAAGQLQNGALSSAGARPELDSAAEAAEKQCPNGASPAAAELEAAVHGSAMEARQMPVVGGSPPVALPESRPALKPYKAPEALSGKGGDCIPSGDEDDRSQPVIKAASPCEALPLAECMHDRADAVQQPAPATAGEGESAPASVESHAALPACEASATVSMSPGPLFAELATAPLLGEATPAAAGGPGFSPGKAYTAPPMRVVPPATASPQATSVLAAARLESSTASAMRLSDAEVIKRWRDMCENMDAGCEHAAVRYRALTLDVSCAAKAHGVRLLEDPQARFNISPAHLPKLLCMSHAGVLFNVFDNM